MYFTGILITGVLVLMYCILILQYRKWYLRLPEFNAPPGKAPDIFFSVVIPARNEEAAIAGCLRAILEQEYPGELREVIVINDHSTDQTETKIRALQLEYRNLKLVNLADHLQGKQLNAYKKKAIEIAIAQSSGQWIVTTDADCLAGPHWLYTLASFITQTQPVFVAAPVTFNPQPSFLSVFQLLDFMSLQGITASSVSAGYHTMCNGANLAYRKDAFYAVGEFSGIDGIASGDDMLLMHKIKQKFPGKLGYLNAREAIITTDTMPDWKSFINQRIRWASKAGSYRDKSITCTLALVYAVNATLLALLLISPFVEHGFRNWLLFIMVKTVVEISFLAPVAKFYKSTATLWWFPLMQPFHILYTVVAGWLGKFGTYQWKGRNVT